MGAVRWIDLAAKQSIPTWATGMSLLATLLSSGSAYAGAWANLVPGSWSCTRSHRQLHDRLDPRKTSATASATPSTFRTRLNSTSPRAQRNAEVARALGVDTAAEGVQRVRELIAQCGAPSTITALNIPSAAIPRLAASALEVQRLLKKYPRRTVPRRCASHLSTSALIASLGN